MTMRRWIAALVACWLWVGIARGQELDRNVPGEGTIFYLQWKGADALRGEYGQSRLKKVVDESNLPRVFSEFLPRVVEEIKKDAPLDAKVLGNWLDALQILGHYPTAIWWGGFVNPADRRPVPRLAVICEPKDQAAAVRDKLLAALGDNANKWTIGIDHGWLWITPVPYAERFQRELEQAGSLAQWKNYQHAKSQVLADAALLAYLDGGNLAGAMKREPTVSEAMSALGLDGLKCGIVASGFDGTDWKCEAFIDAPAPRHGLLSVLDREPLSDQLLDRVPISAVSMTTARLNLLKILDATRAALGKVDPDALLQFNKMLGFATMSLGVNVETDLIASFGDEWLIYDDPQTAGGGIIGTVFVNRLADPVKAQRSMDAVARLANSFMAGQLRHTSTTVTIRQIQSGDVAISYLALPTISPAWTIKDGFLILSFYPEVTARASQSIASGGKSIRDNEVFSAMNHRLGVMGKASAISFHDLPRQAPRAYPVILLLSRAWVGMGDVLGLEAPEMILPRLEKILPQLTPSGSASWADETGWHYRSISPFPFSGIFGGEWGAISSQFPVLAVLISQ
jgi:hypothetical protein